jgi:Na+-translocating ferredoxin:NAD+ oxidoreductase RnfG subunit
MYMTLTMLRALAAEDMTAAEQREAADQLGEIAARLAWGRRRLAERTQAVAAMLAPAGRGGRISAMRPRAEDVTAVRARSATYRTTGGPGKSTSGAVSQARGIPVAAGSRDER